MCPLCVRTSCAERYERAAHGLVELMGGRLSIESRLGSGTTMAITLPAEQTTIEAGDSPAPINHPTTGLS
jgi:hypothetical protein